jgi:cysteine-rich repeat protein
MSIALRWGGLCALLWLAPLSASAQDASVPGTPSAPHPTLEHLSIVWPVDGDADLDGVVTVRYRAVGEAAYRQGLPLFRVPAGTNEGFAWPSTHSGSLFALRAGTTYEVELTLTDPDGGSTTASLTATTRPVPTAPDDARERAVTVETFASVAASAEPGDVLVLAPGTYPGFTFTRDGTAARPIVIRAAVPGEAVIDGEVRLDGRAHVWLEDLRLNDRVVLHTSRSIVVRRCTIETPQTGIVAFRGGTSDSYVCDNVILGPSREWVDGALGASGANLGEGIQLAGPGNVICHNFVRGFRDAISTMEDSEAADQQSLDILDNDIELGLDDGIEADFTMGNVRVLRNRITNAFVGISAQPTLGGPAYFARNVMFNVVYSPFKLHRGSIGDVVLHNTVVKCGDALAVYAGRTWSRALFRNNLFVGGTGGGTYGGYANGDGSVAMLADADASCDFDYDGFGSIGTGRFAGRIGGTRFASLDELRARTTYANAVEVDLGVFAASLAFPSDGPFPEREAPDLRLAAGSAAIDRGLVLPNVNDGFAGSAPDLGAYELGAPVPRYGPRTGAPVCGDGQRNEDEACDDGNTSDGDGCSSTCAIESAPNDAGTPIDASVRVDGGSTVDAGPGAIVEGGCGCSMTGRASRRVALGGVLAVLLLAVRRWRRTAA